MSGEELTSEETAALEAEQASPPPVEEDAPESVEAKPEPEAKAVEERADDSEDDDSETKEAVTVSEGDKPEKKFVPIQARDAERHKRLKVEEQLAELQQLVRQMQAPAQQVKPQDAPAEMPDPVLDPDGFKTWLRAEQTKMAEPFQKSRQQQEAEQKQAQQMQALVGYARQHETAFRKEYADADYDGALNFMRQREARKFEIMGYAPEQIPHMVAQAEVAVTAQAAQRGQNPAALIYNLALENGFTKAEAKAMADDAGDKITRLADVQAKTRSTAGASGAPRPDDYALKDLAAMSERELDALEKKDPEKFRKMIERAAG